ncbi:hypothetical protein IEQ34_027011 [Dendrobium chrysotoxum]|uniref:Uncharacterized protein n=1 Tax=Dendrobium chrysotoxum TaxID=161865 RepID=A0AAV7FIC6_DENCH|nr:hypothetical protein IEQ34_027011 [Dendrobium chrysotoxum]
MIPLEYELVTMGWLASKGDQITSNNCTVEIQVSGDGLAELWASNGGLAELRALGDDSAKVRASGGDSVKARSSSSGPARVRAYGGGPAKVRPSSGGPAKLRRDSGGERLFIYPSCNYKYPSLGGDPIALYDCEWGPNKEARVNETASTITSDFLILFGKNFHFPNNVVTIVPKRSDRVSLPPPGYLTISETNLRAGLRFPPPTELIEILRQSGVNLSQFLFRAMLVTVGLIALFRDRGATLTPEHLSRMGRFTSDTHGRVTFRSKWLDLRTRDPSKNRANAFSL